MKNQIKWYFVLSLMSVNMLCRSQQVTSACVYRAVDLRGKAQNFRSEKQSGSAEAVKVIMLYNKIITKPSDQIQKVIQQQKSDLAEYMNTEAAKYSTCVYDEQSLSKTLYDQENKEEYDEQSLSKTLYDQENKEEHVIDKLRKTIYMDLSWFKREIEIKKGEQKDIVKNALIGDRAEDCQKIEFLSNSLLQKIADAYFKTPTFALSLICYFIGQYVKQDETTEKIDSYLEGKLGKFYETYFLESYAELIDAKKYTEMVVAEEFSEKTATGRQALNFLMQGGSEENRKLDTELSERIRTWYVKGEEGSKENKKGTQQEYLYRYLAQLNERIAAARIMQRLEESPSSSFVIVTSNPAAINIENFLKETLKFSVIKEAGNRIAHLRDGQDDVAAPVNLHAFFQAQEGEGTSKGTGEVAGVSLRSPVSWWQRWKWWLFGGTGLSAVAVVWWYMKHRNVGKI